MKYYILLAYLIMAKLLSGQNVNNVQLPHMQIEHSRKEIRIPDVLGYKTLKCDFHIHTIFSDGIVWPEFRVQEAWEEGLDAISITDHIENQPSKRYVGGDHNASYEIALKKAEEMGVILIRGGEITRNMPPGHLNAIFLSDVNMLATETPFQAIEAAIKQNAFIMWNHPGWKAQQPDSCIWWPEHEELYKKGWIHGIEVFNEKEWYPIALDWCKEKNLAVIANSDIHDVNAHYYDVVNGHRPMTLVLAKTRTLEGIREAMFAKRTIAFFDNKLAGKEEFLKAIFEASVNISLGYRNETAGYKMINIINNSDIPFVIELNGNNLLTLPANGAKQLKLPISITTQEIKVKNLLTSSQRCLQQVVKIPQ